MSRVTLAAAAAICTALAMLVLLGAWGVYRDLRLIGDTLLNAEVDLLRTQAIHVVGRIEKIVEPSSDAPGRLALSPLDETWIERFWKVDPPGNPRGVYYALLDATGVVVMHSHEARVGRQLEDDWYDRAVTGVGLDVFETRSDVLAGGQRSFVVRVPIIVEGQTVGTYHAGFDAGWFEATLRRARGDVLRKWLWIGAGIMLVVFFSLGSLYYFLADAASLRGQVLVAELARAAEVGHLAASLAHEIRNPLHVVRLNLHTFQRAWEQPGVLPRDEVDRLLRQSDAEVQRVERLVSELVEFAKPAPPKTTRGELVHELRAAVAAFPADDAPVSDTVPVEIRANWPESPVYVRFDAVRLRQVLLSLLTSAARHLPSGGPVDVSVRQQPNAAEVTMSHQGPSLTAAERQRLFQPFFSLHGTESGISLALAARLVEAAGGEIGCQSTPTVTTFSLRLPRWIDHHRRS